MGNGYFLSAKSTQDMKKTATLFTLIALLFSSSVNGQGCFSNPAFAQDGYGFYPTGPLVMDCGGLTSSKTFIGLIDSLLIIEIVPGSPTPVTMYMDAMRITEVTGLPSGLSLVTDVMNSATVESPFGAWQNSGSIPNQVASIGCVSVSGNETDWIAAGTGGPNEDGVYPLTISIDTRIAQTNPDLSSIIQNGSWNSSVPLSLGGGVYQIEVELRVNESGCVGGTLFVFPEVTADNSQTPACDGTVNATVYNGTPPYSFLYSNGATEQAVSELCAGVYAIQVEDAVGAQTTSQFAIASTANVYSNVGPSGPNGADTLYSYFYGCDLDYTLPLDSFFIIDAITSGPDTCLVTWVAYQQGNPFTITTYYPFLGPEPTVFSLILWCENGRSEAGIFQLYEFLDLSVGVTEEVPINFMVQPNPSSGTFAIQLANSEAITIQVTDMSGRLVKRERISGQSAFQLDLEAAKPGLYILMIESEKGRGYKQLIKN